VVERPALAGSVPALATGGHGSIDRVERCGGEFGFASRIFRSSLLGLALLGIVGGSSSALAASPAAAKAGVPEPQGSGHANAGSFQAASPGAAAQPGETKLNWTRPRPAKLAAGARSATPATKPSQPSAGTAGSQPKSSAAVTRAASRAAQLARDEQARRASQVVRASHEESADTEPQDSESVAAEPGDFPQTLVPPANALPLLDAKAAESSGEAKFPTRRADLALEPEVDGEQPRLVAEDYDGLGESDSTLREMMDAVAVSATSTELQMASRLQPAGDADLERPADLPGDSEPATDAMLQDVFGADGENAAGAPGEVPSAPALPGEPAEILPPDASAEGAAESTPAMPSEGPAPGEEEAMLDPGDFVPEGSQPGDAEPPAKREPGDEVVDFNGRDCARERHMLQSAWHEMRQTPLHSISLDITPSLEPTGTAEEAEKARLENMERAPARVWHDKNGQVVARGKMVDFKNTRVIVQDESGQLKHLSWYQLGNDELCFVSSWWELPTDATAENAKFAGRHWTPLTMTWVASALCHKPLYFEDVQLERYGHSAKPVRQAALSGVHFFGSIFLLPYNIGMNPPTECQYALGYYRPGSCAPWLVPAFPWSGRGARMQAGALSGAILWYP